MTNPDQFAALDRAIEAGGTALPSATITSLKGKAATAFIEPLLSSGWFVKQGTKYWLTPQGRAVWEQHAPPDRLAVLREREASAQRERLLAFLQLIETKKGKLTATEAKKWSAIIDEALGTYIARGEKANTFILRTEGETLLLAAKPIEEQLTLLRQMHAELSKRWQAIRQRWQSAIDSTALRPTSEGITRQANDALAILERSTAAATVFEELAQAAKTVRQELNAERTTLQEAERRLQEAAQQERAELANLERELTARLSALERVLPTTSSASTTDLWAATQTAYQELADRSRKLGGIVKVPELTDAVLAVHPGNTREVFHRQLLLWEREDRLTLQVCNDRHLETRAAEGIESPRGLLLYVRLR